jgi:hypothetical protein
MFYRLGGHMVNQMTKAARRLGQTLDPLTAGAQDVLEGPNHTFRVPAESGWSGLEIEQMLAAYGVRIWGRQIVSDEIMFTVRIAQAEWAQYLLARHGVPLVDGAGFASSPGALRGPVWRKLVDLIREGFRQALDDLGL